MAKTKDSKPRKKTLKRSSAYVHAAYLADALCDPTSERELFNAASFGLKELCTLLGIEMPKPAPTPKAWKAVKQVYIDARRVIEGLLEQQGLRADERIEDAVNKLELADLYSIAGLAFQVAEQLSELLHHL
jgi:hypothetical protein